jgi:hypothetical protein
MPNELQTSDVEVFVPGNGAAGTGTAVDIRLLEHRPWYRFQKSQ